MGLRWDQWRDGSWRGWHGQWLVGTVATYDRSQMEVDHRTGLRRLVITGRYYAGFVRGDRVGGDCASPAEAMAAVDEARELRCR